MRRVITLELDRARACLQLALVIAHAFGCVELVARAGEMEHVDFGVTIGWTSFPVTWNTATNANYSAQTIGMRESEAIVERNRLREAEQENARWISEAFVTQRIDQIDEGAMMNRDRFVRAKVC